VSVLGKKRHLTFRITAIGTMRVSLDEFTNRETISGFSGGDSDVFAH
jgi:hypothetical protein